MHSQPSDIIVVVTANVTVVMGTISSSINGLGIGSSIGAWEKLLRRDLIPFNIIPKGLNAATLEHKRKMIATTAMVFFLLSTIHPADNHL